MSTDTPGGHDEWLEKVRRYKEAEELPTSDSGILRREQDKQRRKYVFLLERKEKLLGLQSREIVIDPESPETSPDLLQMESIYMSHLVSDDALRALEIGDTPTYMAHIKSGGMLNRFHPTQKEAEIYGRNYEPVRHQIITDLLGTSRRPGTYHVQGLFDTEGVMRGYLSYRLPPKMSDYASHKDFGRAMQKYVRYLEQLLELTEKDIRSSPSAKTRKGVMDYKDSWPRKKTRSELPHIWEFDTINVQKGWGGSGLLLVQNVLNSIEDEFKDRKLLAAFCYRFRGLRVDHEVFGENASSRDFLEGKLGFTEMADKYDPNEYVVREMADGECHGFTPEWTYLYCTNERMRKHLVREMEESGLAS